MSAPASLDHIEEGYVYHDGEARQLYPAGNAALADEADTTAAEAVFFAQCRDIHIGALSIHACLDVTVPSVTIEIRLLGVVIGTCQLSPVDQTCKIGGSIDGFKAEVDLNLDLNPLRLSVTIQLCVPILGCRTFGPFVIPF